MLQVIRKREEGEGGYSESHISPHARARALSPIPTWGWRVYAAGETRESERERERASERESRTNPLSLSLWFLRGTGACMLQVNRKTFFKENQRARTHTHTYSSGADGLQSSLLEIRTSTNQRATKLLFFLDFF